MKQLSNITKASLLAITLAFSVAMIGCESTNDSVDQAKDDVTAAQNDVDNSLQEVTEAKDDLTEAKLDYETEVINFKKESNDQITENEKTIAQFKTEMGTSKKETKELYNKEIAILERKNIDLKNRLDGYQDDNKNNWQTFKTEFSRDMKELGNSFKNFTVSNKK